MSARYDVRDGVAVITLENPPVNGLSAAMRQDIVEGIDRANGDAEVTAIVVTGAGRAFCAGADIREFDTPKARRPPALATVLEAIESSVKPVVAAINSTALGGGLELALAAHYRVAQADAQVGLPEVKLGLLPGCGGTQRLPRAVGLERAVNMIVSGSALKAEKLADTRLFDRIVSRDLLEEAVNFARELGASKGSNPRIRDWKIEHANPDGFDAEGFLAFARTAVATRSKNLPAPLKCVDAIAASVSGSFDEGMKLEQEAFATLLRTPQSQSLRHAFFAERAASRIDDIAKNTPVREIRGVVVVGAGTMGAGISMNFLNAAIPVTLLDAHPEALERGSETIRRNFENSAKKGKLTDEQVQQRFGLLRPTLSYDHVGAADLVIEAVFEDYVMKERVFKKLDATAKPGAILATNTSTLDLNRIAGFTSRPGDVVGLHFFSPANVMRLLEIVRGAQTNKDVLATVVKLAHTIGKTPVVSGVCEGFIGNRMLGQYSRQARLLLDEGALPTQVDHAIEKFGFAMGPFRMSDLAGNDISWAIRKSKAAEHSALKSSIVADRLCEMGRFGQKSGAGWYDYMPDSRSAYPSRVVEDLIVTHSASLGLKRRSVPDSEIVERLVYALVNEGAKILDERIAARASDIDLVYLTGYGFPRWRGGPLFYADTIGLYNVLRAVTRYASGYQGEAWQPAPLLVTLARAGGTFNG